MDDSARNDYFSSGSSRIGHSRRSSNSNEQNIIPHLLAPLPCETHFHPYFSVGENAQNISVQFMHSCPGQDTTQLDSDILKRRLNINEDSPSMAIHPIAYPESSQRTTSHALPPYTSDASRLRNFSHSDLETLHIIDAPLHGPQAFRRCSWPSHPQRTPSPPRILRSPASEPPESTSDESYQDSDGEETTHISPMLNQFQIQSSRDVDLSQHHTYRAQALQPSVMTFQLSQTMPHPVEDPENRHMMRSLLDTNVVTDDLSVATRLSPSSTLPASPPISYGGAALQGLSMRFQHSNEKVINTNQLRVAASLLNSTPFPSSHGPTDSRAGDQRLSGTKQQKKSKMHQCEKCGKLFPRPSGLATHMNTHSGAKPYKCIVPNCEKSFAVRSNAKRHLRTHGINPASPGVLSVPRYMVGFENPMVTHVHDAGKQPLRYRWIPQIRSPHESEWPQEGSSSSAISSGSAAVLTFQASTSSTTSASMSNGSDDDGDEVASSSVSDVYQYQSDYNRSTGDFSGDYQNYGEHSR